MRMFLERDFSKLVSLIYDAALDTAAFVQRHHRGLASRLKALAPHLVRAIEINRQVAATLHVQQALGQSLDAFGAAAFALSPAGGLLHANGLGEAMLRRNDPLSLKANGSLGAKNSAEASLLETAIRGASDAHSLIDPPVRLTSRVNGKAYLAWVMRMRPPAGGTTDNRLGQFDGLDQPGAILVLVTQTDRKTRVSSEVLRSAFALTPAEARLAAALAMGDTLADHASRTGVTRNTLRNQMVSIFEKTGTRRQAELVTCVLAAMGPFAGGRDVE